MQEVSAFFQLGINIFDYFIMLYYFNLLSEKRHGHRIIFWLIGLTYIASITYANQVIGNPWINLLVSVVAVVGISRFFEKKKEIGSLIIYDVIYIATNVAVEIVALCIVKILLQSTNLQLKENYICTVAIARILLVCFCNWIVRRKTKRQSVLAKETELLLCSSTVIFGWIVISLMDKMTIYDGWYIWLYLGAALGCMYLELLLFFLLDKFQKMYQQILENQQMKYELEKKEEYFNMLEEKEKEIRSLRHNLKNQLLELNVKLDNKNAKYNDVAHEEQAKEFVSSLIGALEVEYQYTRNFIVNSILKEKINCAKKKGISVTCEIQISDTFELERGDMGIILGNLLDNAIEASELVEHPYISIQMRQMNKNLYLAIKNHTKESNQKGYYTTKKDKKNHGFGITSVKKTVEKYNGRININREENQFMVELILIKCKN